ncbi:MAG: MotA/TolQ/ExbB proton channel family protein [Crocinitomicaceae bacterium]|nr:MotA/TolQ/ExbB proton channel family protein [Crocinitomicaceae bacterium]
MKKLIASLAIAGMVFFGTSNVYAQDEGGAGDGVEMAEGNAEDTAAAEEPAAVEQPAPAPAENTKKGEEPAPEVEKSFTNTLKTKFIEGGAGFMGIVLVCLIFGLALVIERIIYLNLSSINTKKFIQEIDEALANGGVEAAKEIAKNTRGPIASIYYQGLDRAEEGLEMVEKSVVSYGGVQMGLLDKGVSWVTLFIALAPMLGFMGTVIGMIQAFDKIAEAGTVSPSLVADGIKVALLTTVFGLIVAIILQIFYNVIVAKIEGLVNEMEDSSITLVDLLIKHNAVKK